MTTTRAARPPILGQRALNRALLARQHLLGRTRIAVSWSAKAADCSPSSPEPPAAGTS